MLNIRSTKISKSLCFRKGFANRQDSPMFYYNLVKSKIEMCTEWHLNSQKGYRTPCGLAGLGGWEFFPGKTLKQKHEAQ